MTNPPPPPISLTIAGSDCSGGAGIQADLKTFQAHGVFGLSAITSILAETPHEIRQLEHVDIPLLQKQIHILLETYPIASIKTGLLPSRRAIIAISEILAKTTIPLVIDPILIASTGNRLTDDSSTEALTSRLFPLATLVTPNLPEAQTILQQEITTEKDMETAAREISEKYHTSCLIKGGHLQGNTDRVDILYHEGKLHHFRHPFQNTAQSPKGIHGTGCTLSAAITASIALNHPLDTAVENAITYLQKLIKNAPTWYHRNTSTQALSW